MTVGSMILFLGSGFLVVHKFVAEFLRDGTNNSPFQERASHHRANTAPFCLNRDLVQFHFKGTREVENGHPSVKVRFVS